MMHELDMLLALDRAKPPFVPDEEGDAPGPSWFTGDWVRRAYIYQQRYGYLRTPTPQEVQTLHGTLLYQRAVLGQTIAHLKARIRSELRRPYFRLQNALIVFWLDFGERHPKTWQRIKRMVGAE